MPSLEQQAIAAEIIAARNGMAIAYSEMLDSLSSPGWGTVAAEYVPNPPLPSGLPIGGMTWPEFRQHVEHTPKPARAKPGRTEAAQGWWNPTPMDQWDIIAPPDIKFPGVPENVSKDNLEYAMLAGLTEDTQEFVESDAFKLVSQAGQYCRSQGQKVPNSWIEMMAESMQKYGPK